jgi:hypothetical protein
LKLLIYGFWLHLWYLQTFFIYGFWLHLWYLQTFLFTASDYPFGIFKLFLFTASDYPIGIFKLFYLRLLITPLVSSNFFLFTASNYTFGIFKPFYLRLLITLWYLQTFLFTASDYTFGIFKLFYLRLLITPLESSNFPCNYVQHVHVTNVKIGLWLDLLQYMNNYYNYFIVESGVKHHNPHPNHGSWFYMFGWIELNLMKLYYFNSWYQLY